MRNFSFNKQFFVSKEIKTSEKKNSKNKTYQVLKFRDEDTQRIIQLHYFFEEEIIDKDGDSLSMDMPYVINGFVNNVGYNIFLNIEDIRKDTKYLNQLKENKKS